MIELLLIRSAYKILLFSFVFGIQRFLTVHRRDDDDNAIVHTATTPIATAINGSTVYVHLPSSTPTLIRSVSINPVSIVHL
mmetsp:Transcript_20741/g.23286  ORF Transcript_20741/g.23286 Transcript_20741/m.23286 type:complete len:81 (+) Transcript_20741:61-303(+)